MQNSRTRYSTSNSINVAHVTARVSSDVTVNVSWRHCVTCIVTASSVIKQRWIRWSGFITNAGITQAYCRYYRGTCNRQHGVTKCSDVSSVSQLSPSVAARCCDSLDGHSNLVHPVKANTNPQFLANKNKVNKVQVITKHDLTLGKQRDGLWLMWSLRRAHFAVTLQAYSWRKVLKGLTRSDMGIHYASRWVAASTSSCFTFHTSEHPWNCVIQMWAHTETARNFWPLTQVNFVQMSTHSCLSPWREGIRGD